MQHRLYRQPPTASRQPERGTRRNGPPCAVRALAWIALPACLMAPAAAQTPVQVAPPATARSQAAPPGQVPTPESFYGFKMGADGQLADWTSIQKYFEAVAAKSSRVRLVTASPGTGGRPLMAAIVSAPENIRRLAEIQQVNRLLADPRRLVNDEQARVLIRDQKVVVAIGCGTSAGELGASQAASELLYGLAASADPKVEAALGDVVLILFPSLDPDGLARTVDWHRQTRGTAFEGSANPEPDHKYAGRDLARDMVMLNTDESRALARFISQEWRPQVFMSMRQTGQPGARMIVAASVEPTDASQDPLIAREASLLASAVSLALEADNRGGVVSDPSGGSAWPPQLAAASPGGNIACVLTASADARIASPVQGEAGATARRPPEAGGTWRWRDMVEYDLVAMRGLIAAASRHRDELLLNFYTAGRRAIDLGRREAPYGFVIPSDQFDPSAARKLVYLLVQAGVDVQLAQEPVVAGDTVYPAGTELVLMAQPLRAYAMSLLDSQPHPFGRPVQRAGAGRPRESAAPMLPVQMGVRVDRVDKPLEVSILSRVDAVVVSPKFVVGQSRPDYYLVDAKGSGGTALIAAALSAGVQPEWSLNSLDLDGYRYPAGTLVLRPAKSMRDLAEKLARAYGARVYGARGSPPASSPVVSARTGLYLPWIEAGGGGWTAWLLEEYGFPFKTLHDAEVRAGGLRASFDVIVLPSIAPRLLIEGNPAGTVPEQYAGGLGAAGVAALEAFVEEGGTLVCLDASVQLAIDAMKLPVRNTLDLLPPERFFCPGSLLRLNIERDQPLGFGIPDEVAAYFSFGAAFDISDAARVRIIARYRSKDVLLSGWLEGESEIAGRPAAVEVRAGAGRAILIGFRAEHRGQSFATFRLLFNAILTSARPVPVAPGIARQKVP